MIQIPSQPTIRFNAVKWRFIVWSLFCFWFFFILSINYLYYYCLYCPLSVLVVLLLLCRASVFVCVVSRCCWQKFRWLCYLSSIFLMFSSVTLWNLHFLVCGKFTCSEWRLFQWNYHKIRITVDTHMHITLPLTT